MDNSALINRFAIQTFRDTADQDYIAARLAYRHRLIPQFLWACQQSIEKYIKCILLLNRIKAKSINHDILAGFKLIQKNIPFELQMIQEDIEFIEHISKYGEVRYAEKPYHLHNGLEIVELDSTIWHLRRYCQVIDYKQIANGVEIDWLKLKIEHIEAAKEQPFQKFRLNGGLIEKIVSDTNHPARSPLIWQNLYFGKKYRKSVMLGEHWMSFNPTLALHPEILEEVLEYVFLPKDIANMYR